MLVPPAEAGGPARGCAPAALKRGAVAPPCAPWLSDGVGARSAPTSRRARSPRDVEQGAAFWCDRLKNVRVRLAAYSLYGHIDLPRAVHIRGLGKTEPLNGDLAGWWWRRIDAEHRLVYRVAGKTDVDQRIEMAACRYHY